MLLDELSLWKCVYCGATNDHTQWRCYKCDKKKPKPATVKRIITLRKKKDIKAKELDIKQKTEKLSEPLPDVPNELTFDLNKLQA